MIGIGIVVFFAVVNFLFPPPLDPLDREATAGEWHQVDGVGVFELSADGDFSAREIPGYLVEFSSPDLAETPRGSRFSVRGTWDVDGDEHYPIRGSRELDITFDGPVPGAIEGSGLSVWAYLIPDDEHGVVLAFLLGDPDAPEVIEFAKDD